MFRTRQKPPKLITPPTGQRAPAHAVPRAADAHSIVIEIAMPLLTPCVNDGLSSGALARVGGWRGGEGGIEWNKHRCRDLLWRTGHSFPLPPCLAGHVGRSRYADRLRPYFSETRVHVVMPDVVPGIPRPRLNFPASGEDGSGRPGGHGAPAAFTRWGPRPGHDAIENRRHREQSSAIYSVACRSVGCRSRCRALRPKNSAWLTTADTTASWKGLAMRNAGSGRRPVRKRSG